MVAYRIPTYTYNISILLYTTIYGYIRRAYNLVYMGIPQHTALAQVKFVGKVSSMGDKMIVVIPKDFHESTKKMKGKQVKITIDDEI